MTDLADLLHPGPVVIVGASDRSAWSRAIHSNLTEIGSDRVWLVNPNRQVVHGAPTVPSIDDIADDVRLACITLNANAVAESLDLLGRRGIRNAVIIASGFQEAGAEGKARADQVRRIVETYDMTVIGPNTTGCINVVERFAPFGGVLRPMPRVGGVGIVSQSGALAGQLVGLANARGIGLSRVVATGNELGVTVSDALEYLVEDEMTRAIAVFIEDIKDVQKFRLAGVRALETGKPIVALKVGRTTEGQRAAMSHTGAIAGDDAVIDAAFRQLGVIRVRSLEEMLAVSGLIAGNRSLPGRRMGVVMASGGLCDIIADESYDVGLDLPEFAERTTAALGELLPYYGQPSNPLDLTGVVVADPSVPDRALAVVAHDPNVDFILYPSFTLLRSGGADEEAERSSLQALATMIAAAPAPVVLVHTVPVNIPPDKQALLAANDLHVSVGLEVTLKALGAAVQWGAYRKRSLPTDTYRAVYSRRQGGTDVVDRVITWDEVAAREHLQHHDVAVVPGRLVQSEEDAIDASLAIGPPVAVKVVSAGITHKTEIGGVEIDIDSAEAAGPAFSRVIRLGSQHAQVDGALVTKMRAPCAELLVAVTKDPEWGLMLTLGSGGTAVEVLRDTTSAMLPLTRDDIRDLLGKLRCAPLIVGRRRDGSSLDVDRLIRYVEGVIRAADALGDYLHTLEINPLAVGDGFTEALDVLIMTRSR